MEAMKAIDAVTKSYLLELATEARQRILAFALPDEFNVSDRQFDRLSALLLTCRQFKVDTLQVLRRWSPVLVVGDPALVNFTLPRCLHVVPASNFKDLRLVLYQEAPLIIERELTHDIASVARFSFAHNHDLEDFSIPIHRWSYQWHVALVAAIPDSQFRRVEIDLTPAPRWLRDQYPSWLAAWINASSFTETYRTVIDLKFDDFAQHVATSFLSPMIAITGTFSYKEERFLQRLKTSVVNTGLDVQFYLQYTSNEGCFTNTIPIESNGVQLVAEEILLLAHKSSISWPDRRYWVKVKEIITLTRWTRIAENAFAVCFTADPDWAREHLKRMLLFVADEGYQMRFPPELRSRRELTQKLAECLQISAEVEGQGLERHVVLTRKKRKLRRQEHN